MARISLTRLYLQEEDHELEEIQICDSKLLGRIAELEHSVESSRKVETSDKEINKPTKSTEPRESKIDMNKKESKMDNFDDDLKKMKAVEKKWKNKLAKSKKREKQLWIALLCVCILGVSLKEKEIQGNCHDLFLYQKFESFKTTYLKLIHEVNKGNYITFSVEPFGLPLPLPVGALGVALGPAVCVDIGATTGVALGIVGPAVCVDIGAAAGPEG
ncbi:hypothetical protein H5410_042813, partial [Solanum commersonii]